VEDLDAVDTTEELLEEDPTEDLREDREDWLESDLLDRLGRKAGNFLLDRVSWDLGRRFDRFVSFLDLFEECPRTLDLSSCNSSKSFLKLRGM